MSDAVQLAIVASIAPTIAAVATLVVSWRNGVKVDATNAKVDAVSAKADVIHSLANDNLSKATNAVAVANETIKGQQNLIQSLTKNPPPA